MQAPPPGLGTPPPPAAPADKSGPPGHRWGRRYEGPQRRWPTSRLIASVGPPLALPGCWRGRRYPWPPSHRRQYHWLPGGFRRPLQGGILPHVHLQHLPGRREGWERLLFKCSRDRLGSVHIYSRRNLLACCHRRLPTSRKRQARQNRRSSVFFILSPR